MTPTPSEQSLPFDPAELTKGIRVRPADFARMCNVSRQCVSQWIKNGKIELYPDGTLDPAVAARSIIANTDPAKLRAKVFRVAVNDIDVLRKQIAELERELEEAEARILYLEGSLDEDERTEELFVALIAANVEFLASATRADLEASIGTLMHRARLIAGGYNPDASPDEDGGFDMPAAAVAKGEVGLFEVEDEDD